MVDLSTLLPNNRNLLNPVGSILSPTKPVSTMKAVPPTGGGMMPPTIQGKPLPQTPRQQPLSVPKVLAAESKPMNLFSDEQEAFKKMKDD